MGASSVDKRILVDVRLDPHRSDTDLQELRRGLMATPKRLPSKYFYDRRGSELFERITELPEYYPTRTERSLLTAIADEISHLTAAEELVELGAGAATKTRILLDAMQRQGNLRLYVPFDVSQTEVRRVARELAAEYPDLFVHGIVADFVRHLTSIPEGKPRLVILLGSTIGNYSPGQAVDLLTRLSHTMAQGDFFLLGADLIKEIAVLERAYNDSSGVTAAFNRNILRVVNDIVEGDFEPDLYDHLARYDSRLDRIEMYLVASEAQQVHLPKLALDLEIQQGEGLRTEISCKYDRPKVESMLQASGFELTRWFTDPEKLFALALARKS
jgi:L-histidine N-alpha-methyltransferase